MWIKFSSDEELEGLGFRAKYSFIPDCQFELSGADGIVRSSQVEQEEKTKPVQAVDCIWTIKATPKAKKRKKQEYLNKSLKPMEQLLALHQGLSWSFSLFLF